MAILGILNYDCVSSFACLIEVSAENTAAPLKPSLAKHIHIVSDSVDG
jgi:hypothetical protein